MLCISDHVIWEKDMVVTSSIRIAPGGSLTIKKKLMMPARGKIVIEKKGKLIVDGGLITNACEQWWEGIVKVTSKSSAVFQNGGKTAFTTKEN
jgi:hypothetical protein